MRHKPVAHWQNHTSAIISGFFGEWLDERKNPLAVSMCVMDDEKMLNAQKPDPKQASKTLCVLVHGLMELETVWNFPENPSESYGRRLVAKSGDGMTTLSLRYNTGLPIYQNGEAFAEHLEYIVGAWPVPVERLILIGHSMGGLLVRSACHYGQQAEHRWISTLKDCVYIGSPHDGSWLAKSAHSAAGILSTLPKDYLKVIGEVIDLRSEGIRNLSRGEVVPAGEPEPQLLQTARHYVVHGSLSKSIKNPFGLLFGDALVHESSATGKHKAGWQLAGTAAFPGINHIQLAHDENVAEQLEEWLL